LKNYQDLLNANIANNSFVNIQNFIEDTLAAVVAEDMNNVPVECKVK